MPSLRITAKTPITPEQFVAALTNFGPERGALWNNSQASHFTLHKLGSSNAEVTEGSKAFGGVWERLLYDWSKPDAITLRTIDSNIWAPGSGWRYKIEQAIDGDGTIIHAKVTRLPNSKRGYIILIIVATVGRPFIKRSFRNTLRAIEQQSKSQS